MSEQYPDNKVVLSRPGRFVKADEISRGGWRHIKQIANEFWVRWCRECRNFQKIDIVLLKTEANRNQWPMLKVVSVNADDMGFV